MTRVGATERRAPSTPESLALAQCFWMQTERSALNPGTKWIIGREPKYYFRISKSKRNRVFNSIAFERICLINWKYRGFTACLEHTKCVTIARSSWHELFSVTRRGILANCVFQMNKIIVMFSSRKNFIIADLVDLINISNKRMRSINTCSLFPNATAK